MRKPVKNTIFYKYKPFDLYRDEEKIVALFIDEATPLGSMEIYTKDNFFNKVNKDYIERNYIVLAKIHEYEALYRELINIVEYKLNVLNDDFEYLLEKDIIEAIREKCYITQDDSDDIHDSVYNVSSVVMGFIKEKFL